MLLLTSRLEAIQSETGEGQAATTVVKGGDEFVRLKKQIAASVKNIRDKLGERDELLGKGASGTKATVQVSHQIRQQLQQVRADANHLMALQRKEATKARGKDKSTELAQGRQDVVELVFKHIEECELQEKKRYASKNAEARVDLFAAGGRAAELYPAETSRSACGAGTSSATSCGGSASSLPDIDAETQEGLQLLERKNQAIDEQLDVVAEGVSELKTIALTMRDEVKVQSAMVDEITNKVDAASSRLNSMNKKMRQTLAQTRSADRFILDFILCVILLGIIGYIVSLVSGNS